MSWPSLNPEQREAVEHPDGPLLVLAGAGSGKTRVLTARVARLIEEGVEADRILAVTFTNRAAGEMRERIEGLIGRSTRGLWIGTFHSIAARLLRREAAHTTRDRSFTIYDEDDTIRALKDVMESTDYDPKRWSPRAVRNRISTAKNALIGPSEYAAEAFDLLAAVVADVYPGYQRVLVRRNAYDFDDLLFEAVRLLEGEVGERYASKFSHVLVDEYQDTNHAQYRMVKALARRHGNLCVVGDDDQCLVEGTLITMADGRRLPIERVCPGDEVWSGYGSGDFRPARVERTVRFSGCRSGIEIRTEGHKRIVSTREHIHFAGYRLGASPQRHFVYLMGKRTVGFRLGTSQMYTSGQAKPMAGFVQRSIQEHADAAWVVSTHATGQDARAQETLLSLQYGIPTLPFTPRRGKGTGGLVHDGEALVSLFAKLDTGRSAMELMGDYGLSPDHPHHAPQARDSNRRRLRVTLCGDRRGRTPMHRISLVGNDEEGRAALEQLGLSVRPAKRGSESWRFETARADPGELWDIAERVCGRLGATIVQSARLGLNADRGSNSLPFMPASAVRPGMVMFDDKGRYDAVVEVVPVELEGSVYDLDVERTHNFVANGIVTHNSIYAWRGADVRNILDFERDFEGAHAVRLEQNYRSTGSILEVANAVIELNVDRKPKRLRTDREMGDPIQVVRCADERQEARWVADDIERLRGGRDLDDFAVLYRTNAQSRAFEEAFRRSAIAYRIVGGVPFYERREIKDVLAYLRLAVNPADDAAFQRAIGWPRRGVGQKSLEHLMNAASQRDEPLLAAAERAPEVSEIGKAAQRGLREFVEGLRVVREAVPTSTAKEALEKCVAAFGLATSLAEEEDGADRLENVSELFATAAVFSREDVEDAEDEAPDLELYLQSVALRSDLDEADFDGNAVTMMTLHNAKGLEFPVVFLGGLEEGLFPLSRAIESEGGLEEERRLFYVGVTRTMDRLTLSYADRRWRAGMESRSAPSSFLDELPEEHIETRLAGRLRSATPARTWQNPGRGSRGASEGLPHAPSSGAAPGGSSFSWHREAGGGMSRPERGDGELHYDFDDSQLALELAPGVRIMHPRFGAGEVLDVQGVGQQAKAEIEFEKVGRKKVLVAYAGLRPA